MIPGIQMIVIIIGMKVLHSRPIIMPYLLYFSILHKVFTMIQDTPTPTNIYTLEWHALLFNNKLQYHHKRRLPQLQLVAWMVYSACECSDHNKYIRHAIKKGIIFKIESYILCYLKLGGCQHIF